MAKLPAQSPQPRPPAAHRASALVPQQDQGELDEHDGGLAADLPVLLDRRRALSLLGLTGIGALAACSTTALPSGTTPQSVSGSASASDGNSTVGATATPGTSVAASSTRIPEETAGPFPADGSNGVDVLGDSGIIRRDIRSSFGTSTTTAAGVPLTVTLRVMSVAAGATPLVGAAVYLWHCDREGRYSMYSPGVTQENYLRGVQPTAADGTVTFQTIFPAAYSGRWPHLHFEIYPSIAQATAASDKLRTSQLALPAEVCEAVYASPGYEASAQNLRRTSLATDTVFRDGWSLQLATVTGDVGSGYAATLPVPV
ncbi:MAG: hypothetical protein EPO13_06055 [Actinomycetota bacterium]|nr:MAG: hypothetical protein EPO13_06055 [Actinomycetota bacterium]